MIFLCNEISVRKLINSINAVEKRRGFWVKIHEKYHMTQNWRNSAYDAKYLALQSSDTWVILNALLFKVCLSAFLLLLKSSFLNLALLKTQLSPKMNLILDIWFWKCWFKMLCFWLISSSQGDSFDNTTHILWRSCTIFKEQNMFSKLS